MKIESLENFIWARVGNKWFYSKSAAILFATASLLSVGTSSTLIIMLQSAQSGQVNGAVAGPLGGVGALSAIILVTGMSRVWTELDGVRSLALRRTWFVVLLVGLWYGATLYCFFVYLPMVKSTWRANRT